MMLNCFFFFHSQIIQKPTHDLKQQLTNYSKRVAGSVTELIQAAEAMKGILSFNLKQKGLQNIVFFCLFDECLYGRV